MKGQGPEENCYEYTWLGFFKPTAVNDVLGTLLLTSIDFKMCVSVL